MIPHAEINEGFLYILTLTDYFSKYAWTHPITRETGYQEVADAMNLIFESPEKRFSKPPKLLQVDRGPELYSKIFCQMLSCLDVKIYCTHLKANIYKRFYQTLKNLMYREFSARCSHNWINILDNHEAL